MNTMPFEERKLPVCYLGVPRVSTRLIHNYCKTLVEPVRNRIGIWRNKSLSFMGRIQLISSVLSSMHVYRSSVFILPNSITPEIKNLLCGFLWYNGEMKKGKSKVAWNKLCTKKKRVV